MRAGLVRKASLLVVLWTLYFTTHNILPYFDPNFISPFSTIEAGITGAFIMYEGVSIIENLGLLGVEIPEGVRQRFRQIQDSEYNKMEGDRLKNDESE